MTGPRVDHAPDPAPTGQAATTVAAWPAADLERRVERALACAGAVVSDFGETGYADPLRPALSFGPDKVVAEAAMLAYAASGASPSPGLRARVDALAEQLAPLVRSPGVLADLALNPDRVFRRVVPHVLLTALGHPDETFDAYVAERCERVLAHAVDQPATVLAERRWITGVWGRDPHPEDPWPAGTVLDRPFDLLVGSREDPYGLTHLLFYVTDFGRAEPSGLGRPPAAVLADVEALVIRYLDQGDYDLLGELLMAWPQLRAPWSPVAAFALRVLLEIEDEVGVLPCGNLDPQRLAGLAGADRRRYARAASYHTALVMGFLCAATLRSPAPPPRAVAGPQYPDRAWRTLRADLAAPPGEEPDWVAAFDRAGVAERRALAPMLAGLAITRALRRRDFAAVHATLGVAARFALPPQPWQAAAADLLQALSTGAGLRPPEGAVA